MTAISFDDVVAANEGYADAFAHGHLLAWAEKGLAIVTCMDPRIDTLRAFGLEPGDAAVLRVPGARVSGDVVRGLALARELLGVERVMVVGHTQCRAVDEHELEGVVIGDVAAVDGLDAAGFVYHVETGRLRRIC